MLFLLSLLALINAEKEVGWFGALNHLMNNKECTVDDCIAPCQVDHHGARRGEKWCKVAKEAKCKDQQWEALYGDFSYQACKETCVCIDKCVRDNFGHDAGRSWCKVAQNSGCGDEKFKVLWGHYSYEACEAQGVTAETSGYVAPPEEAEETAAPVVATLVKEGVECRSADKSMGKKRSLQECADAVHAYGGSFFLFGTGRKAGKCYTEHTSSAECPEGWESDSYNFYTLGESTYTYTLEKEGSECRSRDTNMGKKASLKECADAVQRAGGSFFVYGTGHKKGNCYSEHTTAGSCPEGWQHDHYNFYSLAALTAEPTEATAEPTEATSEPTEATAEPTEATAEPTEATQEPTEATAEPTEATEEPTEATAEPTEATEEPTEATAEPTEATEEPTEATEEPTEATAEPTEATQEPTEATAEPTEATEEPTEATPEPTTLDPTEATQEPTSPYFLAEAAAYTCPEGSGTVDEADCEAVAAGLATSPAGRSLRKGSGGSCAGWSWGSVPVGCSLQSGGDNTAHYKSGGVTGPGCVKDKFQLVCEYGKENIDLELKTFALSLDSSTQMAVNGFAAIGLGFLLYGAAKFYLVKSQDEVAYSEI